MKITVAGSGYVGLSISVLLAQNNSVKTIDIVEQKVDMVNNRISPIQDEYIEKYLSEKDLDLVATTDTSAYADADFAIIATPTNYDSGRNYFDTSAVESAISACMSCNDHCTIVIKSTIPEGFTQEAREKFHTDRIIFSPEFLRESKALYDNLYPSRIIVGTDLSSEHMKQQAELFADLLKGGAIKEDVPVLVMGFNEAEAVKLFANTYLADRVAYFNELDTYAESKGLDARSIIDGVSMDPRIGRQYNNPSFGYGGYCLPKDSRQLRANFADANVPNDLVRAICKSNHTRKDYITNQILAKNPSVVGIYRLIMKSDSDNFRSSAVQGIINRLCDAGVKVIIYEPTLKDGEYFLGCENIGDFENFVHLSDVIAANRMAPELKPYLDKVYTRDLFSRD